MPRTCTALILVLSLASPLLAQDPLANLPNLIANGGFEDGTKGWRVTIGPYGQGEDPWSAAKGVAEVVSQDVFAGARGLRLDAREQPNEVDVTVDRLRAEPNQAYLLGARVWQLAGEGGYKVVIDWLDAEGKHLRYDNDWRGNDHPKSYANHGGVFVSPENAAYAVVLLGVSKGVECLFDEIRLSALPIDAGQQALDGEGEATVVLPATVEAGGYGTFRLTYHPGPHGLPVGAAIEFRRSNVDPRWSLVQTTDPKRPGYTTVKASNGAACLVQPGGELQVPSVTRVTVEYPALGPGDTLEIIYGDTSGGGPGAEVQPKAEPGVGFLVAMDGDRDGRALDLPDPPGACGIVPGPLAQLGLITPVVAEVGRPFAVALEARDRNGNVLPDYAAEARVGAAAERFVAADHGRHGAQVTLDEPGLRVLKASSGSARAEQTVIAIEPLPDLGPPVAGGVRARTAGDIYVLENRFVRLVLPRSVSGYGVGLLEADLGGTWQRAGTIRSMGELWTGPAGQPSTRTPVWLPSASAHEADGTARVTLRGGFEAGGRWSGSVDCTLTAEARHVEIRSEVDPAAETPLRAFYGPIYYAGDGAFGARKDSGLFPGLEYLAGDEVSSGDYGIVPPYSNRLVPNPLKITMPLMAVAADGLCTMAFWHPELGWGKPPAAAHRAACFDSPARHEDRDAHLFALLGPSVLEGLPENARETPEPTAVAAGSPLIQEVSIAALPGADVTAAVRYWFDANGVPDPPPAPRTWAEESRLVAHGLSETAWDPAKKGWHSALDDPWGAGYNSGNALLLHQFTRANPTDALTPAITRELAEAWAANGNQRGFDEAFVFGDSAAAVSGLLTEGLRLAFGMSPEGAYAFHPTAGGKMISQAQSRSLGKDGDVNVGTCVMGLEPLMRAALFTGDPLLVQAGEKGLAYLDRFSRPQGAENWEVPLACPNLRAAALATRCYLYGYELTGKPAYLDRARHWATTGLPFLYTWNAADRPVMLYASISVMGTSIYTGLWFGNAVQWVGLVYADAIRELAPYDTDFPWAKVADGVLISAMQQQKTDASPCKHVGFFPDSYSPVKGDETYHWCLAPTAIGLLAEALHGTAPAASATVLRVPDGRTVHVISPGRTTNASFDGGTLRFTSHYLSGGAHEIVIARVARADQVTVDGVVLPRAEIKPDGDPLWQATAWGSLRLRIRSTGEAAQIELRGCELVPAQEAVKLGAIANGDFEQGLLHWGPSPPERVHIVADAHEGRQALELDGVGATSEVQCGSRPMRVTAGKTYELASRVKETAGDGSYKVTVDWCGPAGHIKYDNDWAGTDRPTEYTLQGGRFVAPAGAESALVILGVRAGTRCVFDDVSLTPID